MKLLQSCQLAGSLYSRNQKSSIPFSLTASGSALAGHYAVLTEGTDRALASGLRLHRPHPRRVKQTASLY